jgi:hypothetical protein
MSQKKIIVISIVAVLAGLVAAGALVFHNVAAQAPAATPTAQPGQGRGSKNGNSSPLGVSDQDLANALGITVDKLTAAYKTADTEALKQAVSKGLINPGPG